ncbi:hypothetical protein [Pseudomonas sp. OTU750018]|uniref:hypothetical protein n=1 Tax=Pseudomonas sp. OTU750018 TaxID=2709708 RepID=UPI00141F23DB|nr:hypothetical protein [Pseudomonas sp. OTU750018]
MDSSDLKRTQLEKLERLRQQLKDLPARARDQVFGELTGRSEQLYEVGILTRQESDEEHVKSDIVSGRASSKILVS